MQICGAQQKLVELELAEFYVPWDQDKLQGSVACQSPSEGPSQGGAPLE